MRIITDFFLVANLFWSGLMFRQSVSSGFEDTSEILIGIFNFLIGIWMLSNRDKS